MKWRPVGRKGEKRPRKIKLTEEEKREMEVDQEKDQQMDQELTTVNEQQNTTSQDETDNIPPAKRARLKRKATNPYR